MYNRGPILSEDEIKELYDWITGPLFNHLRPIVCNRLLYKFQENDPHIISLVWEIEDRLCRKEGLEHCIKERKLKNFIMYIPKGGCIDKHIDPNKNELLQARFNIYIKVPEGDCKTYYGGNPVTTIEGSYVLSRSGIDYHWSEMNTSDTPRISLSFGYLVTREKLDELTSDPKVGTYRFYPLALPK
jgi:hypothetical protein